MRSRFVFVIMILLCCTTVSAQKNKKPTDQPVKFIYPEIIEAGSTVAEITRYVHSKGKKDLFFAKGNGKLFEKSYTYTNDIRINNQMHLSSYQFLYKNDSCVMVLVKPEFNDSWKEELLKNHDFESAERELKYGRTLYRYVSKSGRYKLVAFEEGGDELPSNKLAYIEVYPF